MKNYNNNLKNLSTPLSLFKSNKSKNKEMKNSDMINEILNKYFIKDMNDWENVNANLIITDPPFGIEFSGKNGNYHRNVNNVVDGYVEWKVSEYEEKIQQLLEVIKRNLKENGQALIFSGWNNSNIIHNKILEFKGLTLRGKMYWVYNFAPVCRRKPSHNVYEIYWITKGEKWTFNNRCSTHHCQQGEPNLSTLIFKRDYKINMPKYPTRLPFKLLQCLLEHFSNEGDLIFDPLCGSGMVGVVSHMFNRNFVMGDLNKNGKLVFKHLLDYYLNNNGLFQDIKISSWWKNKK
ncbi:MAG TPA: site-specific DNA-methyltransferase [Elusimicrobiales bacterium]|nr:site-specific DNA-methyltransferase [Elusimicrobiales bacterium]HPO94772.1 site-specific DNA-methyltransferase [Elusimicrobiales bacterium]